MSSNKLKVTWYRDPRAEDRGEPGLVHSFLTSLASALQHVSGPVDPARLAGDSAFAFRIWAAEAMCPSAMSLFDWNRILPEAVEQSGRRCRYVSRDWDEKEHAAQRRRQAHQVILASIDRGAPAVVWDVADSEWGLIVGYDEERRLYDTLTHRGAAAGLPFARLGANGIDVLSVATLGEPNERSRDEIVVRALRAAVAHAAQEEWSDSPQYQNGLAAFDLWAVLYDRWAWVLRQGKPERIGVDTAQHSIYYAGHVYSARCYARDYLRGLADEADDPHLRRAAASYATAAAFLHPVWACAHDGQPSRGERLSALAQSIRAAKSAEEEGLERIRDYLARWSPARAAHSDS